MSNSIDIQALGVAASASSTLAGDSPRPIAPAADPGGDAAAAQASAVDGAVSEFVAQFSVTVFSLGQAELQRLNAQNETRLRELNEDEA